MTPRELSRLVKRRPRTQLAESLCEIHPDVLKAWHEAEKLLKRARVRFTPIGRFELNLLGVGSPTFDVDLLVSMRQFERAVVALRPITQDIEQEKPVAILKTSFGPFLELFPSGITAGQIAALRGKRKNHPAAQVKFLLRRRGLIGAIENKLASFFSATDRQKDAGDVQELIKKYQLLRTFAHKLHPSVRSAFLRLVPKR